MSEAKKKPQVVKAPERDRGPGPELADVIVSVHDTPPALPPTPDEVDD